MQRYVTWLSIKHDFWVIIRMKMNRTVQKLHKECWIWHLAWMKAEKQGSTLFPPLYKPYFLVWTEVCPALSRSFCDKFSVLFWPNSDNRCKPAFVSRGIFMSVTLLSSLSLHIILILTQSPCVTFIQILHVDLILIVRSNRFPTKKPLDFIRDDFELSL